MIEVKDEILNGEPKYRLRDENGDIIYDNVSVEMTTPVVEEGTPLNKAFFDIVMPSGLICMWSGTTIPTGWLLCDGTNGTPDLRDRFIVGSGSGYNIGDTGGSDSVTLTVNQIPAHSHNIESETTPAGGTGHYCYTNDGAYGPASYNTKSTGGGQPFDNRPPYYALAFIMKA